jgi:succinate dehydrogenase / fumarate reductase cytochrome b subunit
MSEKTNSIKRPLSPHLQVYRLPMMAKMSISHRATGVLLTAGLVVMAIWFLAAALGEEQYNQAMLIIDTRYTKYVFVAWAFALFYHMGSGIRHMIWDVGFGLNEKTSIRTGWMVILFAVAMTYGVWSVACGCYAKVKDDVKSEEVSDVPVQ